jgi:uncharacterized sodium:solute symporter family permease YidK
LPATIVIIITVYYITINWFLGINIKMVFVLNCKCCRLLPEKYFGDLKALVEGFIKPKNSGNSLLTGTGTKMHKVTLLWRNKQLRG